MPGRSPALWPYFMSRSVNPHDMNRPEPDKLACLLYFEFGIRVERYVVRKRVRTPDSTTSIIQLIGCSETSRYGPGMR